MRSTRTWCSASTRAAPAGGRARALATPAPTVTPCRGKGRADSAEGGTLPDSSRRSIWEKMLEASYRLHTIEATDLAVLDLITSDAREAVGLEDDDIYGDDWSACQAVGHAAWFLHVQGVLVPAAGGIGLVITAYEQRTRPGQLHVSHSEDLTPTRYGELRHP